MSMPSKVVFRQRVWILLMAIPALWIASPASACNGACQRQFGCLVCGFTLFDTGQTCYDAIPCFHCVNIFCEEDPEGPITPPGATSPTGESMISQDSRCSSTDVVFESVAVVEIAPRT